MTPATNDSLAPAIDYLGAVEVEPGRYAWKRFDGWITGGTLQVEHAAYDSHAFAAKPKLMPSWWSPEQREAWKLVYPGARHIKTCSQRYISREEADLYRSSDAVVTRVTADLETGQEVPA